MAVLSVADLRKRIQTRMTATLGAQGWRPSRYVPELFGHDTDSIAPRSFSVGVNGSRPVGDRQRLSAGTVVETSISVRFAWRLRGDAQMDDYDQALGAEEDVLVAVMSTSLEDLHIRLDSIPPRRVFADGSWFMGELIFRTEHRLPLV